MAIVERGKCTITTLNDRGLGVGQSSGGEVQVPYTLPGDEISFERHSYREVTNCILKDVIIPSTKRIDPPCKYFGACGGCLLQHINIEEYTKFKYDLVRNALLSQNISTHINSIITIPSGQRRKGILEAVKKNGQVFLGFLRFQSNQIININECIALLPELSRLLPNLKILLLKILADKQKAKLFLTKASNGIDLVLEIKGQEKLLSDQRSALCEFADVNSLIRLVFRNESTSVWDIIHKSKDPYIKLGGIPVEVDSQGFLQVSFASDQILAELVLKSLSLESNGKIELGYIADLFCGRGTLTLPLSEYYKVDGFELDQEAIRALEKAAKESNRPIKIQQRNLFSSPLSWSELNKYKAVVINPPRAGAKEQCRILQNSLANTICYISCNPESFVKDAKTLLKGPYKLIEVTPVDQFYWTPHIELVGVFQRVLSEEINFL